MKRRTLVLGGLLAVPTAGAGYWLWPRSSRSTPIAPTMTNAEFDAIRAAVRPVPGEDRFAEIPWEVSLWSARQRAAREGKPILLWEMDGHPLGCG